jgi:ribosomal protein S18 acetylase RimI-like enzyme
MMDEETGRASGAWSRSPPPAHMAVNDDEDDDDDGNDDDDDEQQDDEEIAGCVVGSFVEASSLSHNMRSLLLSDPTRHSRLFYIMTLGTVQEYRHIGLGSDLVQDCLHQVQTLENANCGTCYLHVITSNTAAIQFYEKLGFYRVLQIDDYYDISGEKHACFLYARYFHGNRGHRDVFKMFSRALWSVWRHVTTSVLLLANSSHLSLGETIAALAAVSSSSSSLSSDEEMMEP